MAFRGEMDNRGGALLIENAANQCAIHDVSAHEAVPVVLRNRLQILKIPGIRQLVQDGHSRPLLGQPLQHKIGADKAGPAGYQ
jgi:hypothetical protein